jgi:hypothetical protein
MESVFETRPCEGTIRRSALRVQPFVKSTFILAIISHTVMHSLRQDEAQIDLVLF